MSGWAAWRPQHHQKAGVQETLLYSMRQADVHNSFL